MRTMVRYGTKPAKLLTRSGHDMHMTDVHASSLVLLHPALNALMTPCHCAHAFTPALQPAFRSSHAFRRVCLPHSATSPA